MIKRAGNRVARVFAVACKLVLLVGLNETWAQTQLCACTPISYGFILNLTLTCPETTIARSAGITDIQCTTTPDVSLDAITAEAYSIQFVELDQNRLVLKSSTIDTPVPNGGTVTYESYSASPQGDGRVPGSLKVGIAARDATTSTVFQQWVLQYSNSCTDYPVISDGQQIGWMVMGNLTPPSATLCPAASGPTPPTPSNSSVAPISLAPGTIAPSPTLRVPTPTPIAFTTFPPSIRPLTKQPSTQPGASEGPHQTNHPTVHCPPDAWSKGKGKGKGMPYGNLFDRVFIPSDCFHKSSKSKKAKSSKGWKSTKSKSVKLPKGPGLPKGPSKGADTGKGYYEWPTRQPSYSSSKNAMPSSLPMGSPVRTLLPMPYSTAVPGGTPQPSWQYSGPTITTPSALMPSVDDQMSGVPISASPITTGPSTGASTGSPTVATGGDGSSTQAPNADDNASIPVESAEPPLPTQSPGTRSTTTANQVAVITGIVMAGFVVTVIATTLLVRSAQRPKQAQQPPTLVGGSMTGRMSTGETLSVESRPSSGAGGHRLSSAKGGGQRLASTIATGFQEGPILEETMMAPPPSPESTAAPETVGGLVRAAAGGEGRHATSRDPAPSLSYLQFPHYYSSPNGRRPYVQPPAGAEYLSRRWGDDDGDDSDASHLVAD